MYVGWKDGRIMGLFLLTLLPIVVILCMLIIWRKPADISGIAGWLVVSAVAFVFFNTSFEVVWRSTLSGLIKSFSVSLIVATSLLQMAMIYSDSMHLYAEIYTGLGKSYGKTYIQV
jgi:L-lactate permease